MLPHKERLDLFPLRTAPPKHGFWVRSKHFSVTHVLNFVKINRNYLRELQYFPPHTNIRPQPGCDTHIQGWRGALASFAFPHKLLVGMTGGCRAAAFFLSELLRRAGEPLAPQLTIWESLLHGWPPPFLKQVSNVLGLRLKHVVKVYILSLCQEIKSTYLMDHWVQRLFKMPLSHFHL